MRKISVIIPAYNNPDELVKTLNALVLQTMPTSEFEVIIGDDGSSVDMRSSIADFSDKLSLKYFWQEDKGFCPGSARNMGIRMAEGELCVFFDSGVVPVSSCLEEHYRVYAEVGERVVILGYIYGNDTHSDLNEMREIVDSYTPDEAAKLMQERSMMDGREKLYAEFGEELNQWPAPWVALWSLHFSVPTKFMRENNIYFDEHFNTWGSEDNEFGIQLLEYGAIYTLCRSAQAIHYPAKIRSYEKLKIDKQFCDNFRKNQEYVVSKYSTNRSVRLWYEEGWVKVNRILLEEQRLTNKD